jgi:cellulose synthase/poly-beta-1,6-N-acetylglucosamine synthase-like glycosyltransferase
MILPIAVVAALALAAYYLIAVPLSALRYVRVTYPRFLGTLKGEPDFPVQVIVPCKGTTEHLLTNLRAIAAQDYPRALFTFVTDTEDDGAREAIEAVTRGNPRARHLVAGLSPLCAQKNFVQIAAIESDPVSDVFVVCDSDLQPATDWLREMVRPFVDPGVSVTGATRWIQPHARLAGPYVYALLGSYYAMMLATPLINPMVWGGCFAISRKAWGEMGIREIWSATASDDLTLSAKMMEHHVRQVYVPRAVSPSYEVHTTLLSLCRWYTRQTVTGRVHAPASVALEIFIETFVMLSILGSVWLFAAGMAGSVSSIGLWAPPILWLMLVLNGLLVKLPYRSRKDMPLVWWCLGPFLGHLIVPLPMWRSLFIRKFHWGVVTYEFNKDRTVKRLVRKDERKQA